MMPMSGRNLPVKARRHAKNQHRARTAGVNARKAFPIDHVEDVQLRRTAEEGIMRPCY